jgi:hypothetical protein
MRTDTYQINCNENLLACILPNVSLKVFPWGIVGADIGKKNRSRQSHRSSRRELPLVYPKSQEPTDCYETR